MKKSRLSLVILIFIASTTRVMPTRSEVSLSGFKIVDVYWGTDQPTEVSSGDVETLTVVLRYESSYFFTNLKADLSLPNGFRAVGGGNKATTHYTGPVSMGSLVMLSFPISIAPDVEKGSYRADLRLEYIYVTAPAEEELKVTFEVTGKPSIGVKVLNDSFYEGKQQILIALSNDGDAIAKNLEIVRVYSSSASVEPENGDVLGDLEPEDNVTVPLNLFVPAGMKSQVLPLSVEVSYLGPRNVVYLFSETLQLPIKPSDLIPPLTLSLGPSELSIGKRSKVYVELENTGHHDLSEIKLTLSPDNVLKVFGPTILYIDRLGSEESRRIETEVYVPSATIAPTASLTIAVTYFDEGPWMSQSEVHVFSMLLRPSNPMPALRLSLDPRELSVGKSRKVYLDLMNNGSGSLSEIKLTLSPDNVLKVFGATVLYVDSLGPEESRRVETELHAPSTTVASTASLTVTVIYFDEGFWMSQSEVHVFSILLRPSNPMPALRLSLDPRELSIGRSSKVYIDLKNIGDRDISEISLTLSPDNVLKIFGPTVSYIDRLGPAESRRIETELYVPSTTVAPTGSLTVVTTYVDEDFWSSQSESHRLSLLLRGLIEISLTDVAVIPSTPRSGSPFSITITVTNIGTSTAYAAYAIPDLEGLPLKTFGAKSTYIGNIETNLPTTFTVNLQLLNTTERSITLPVTLSYMDNLRSLHNVTYSVPINVAPQTSSSSQTSQQHGYLPAGGWGIGIVAVVAIAAVVVIIKKRRQRG